MLTSPIYQFPYYTFITMSYKTIIFFYNKNINIYTMKFIVFVLSIFIYV